jgi:hypothetical protein
MAVEKFTNSKTLTLYLLLLLVFASSKAVCAEDPEIKEWSFSVVFGLHQPSLKSLNENLFKTPIVGVGTVILNSVTEEETEDIPFEFDNFLPPMTYGGKAAFELQWHPNLRHTLLFGMGSWENISVARQFVDIPSRTSVNTADFKRTATLSYTEYSLGWDFAFWKRPRYSFYIRSSIHQVFDIDYREDFVFSYLSGSGLVGFERIQKLEAQTASLFMGQLALGAEVFFHKWLSLGIEAGYLKGERNVQLHAADVKTDFISRDNVEFTLPYGLLSDGNLGYLSPDSTQEDPKYERLKLDFSGWQVVMRLNVFY